MKGINTLNAPQAIGPYSQAVESNGMLYVSGQLPINPESGEMKECIKCATKQCLENIKAIVLEAGSDMSKVVKTTVLMKSLSDFADMNEVYATFFQAPFPARACFEVAGLPKGAIVEIEAIVSL